MANGKVITGYSFPRVAKYTANEGVITYSEGMPLARGVDVSVDAESGDGVNFYADNVLAESAGGIFTGATASFTIDGLKAAARKLIMGLPAADSIEVGGQTYDVVSYDDRQSIPNLGVGFVVRYMENGNTSYTAVVLNKVQFNVDGLEAATQEETIEFQTTELEATVMRDDSTNHGWRKMVEDLATEEEAVAVIDAILNIQAEGGDEESA